MAPLCSGFSKSVNLINSSNKKLIASILVISTTRLWLDTVYLYQNSEDSIFLF